MTVPIKFRVDSSQTVGDIRRQLAAKGVCVGDGGSFYAKGDPKGVDDSTCVAELPDVRLLYAPNSGLLPWQLCLAHRASQQLVAARAFSTAGPVSFESMVARNPLYKTRLCNAWLQAGGHCPRGPRCIYAHGPAELRARQGMQAVGQYRPLLAPGLLPPQRPILPPGLLRPPGPGLPGPLVPDGLPSGMLPIGAPSAPAAIKASVATPALPPEVVFTVDEAEAKKRAERARRFATRTKASFDADEPNEADNSLSDTVGTGALGDANSGGGPPLPEDGSFAATGGFPAGGACGGAMMGGGGGEALEEQIADYILEMEQQFLSSLMPPGGNDDAAGALVVEGASTVPGGFGEQCMQTPMLGSADESVSAPVAQEDVSSQVHGEASEPVADCIPSVPKGSLSEELPPEQDVSQTSLEHANRHVPTGPLEAVVSEEPPTAHSDGPPLPDDSSAQQPGVSSEDKVPIPIGSAEPKLEDLASMEESASQTDDRRQAVVAQESTGEPEPGVQGNASAPRDGD